MEISTKLFGNVVTLKTFLSTITSIIHVFIQQKFCINYFLWGRKYQTAKTRQLITQTFIYYLIYSGPRKVFHKIMQRMFFFLRSTY